MSSAYKKQSGFLAILAAVIIVIFGSIGAAVVYLSRTTNISSTYLLSSDRGDYAAFSGVEAGLLELYQPTVASRSSCSNLSTNLTLPSSTASVAKTTATEYPTNPIYSASTMVSLSTTNLVVNDSSVFAIKGRVYIDREAIDYQRNDTATNTLSGLTRGADGTVISTHVSTSPVSQFMCTIESSGFSPNATSPRGEANILQSIQQETVVAVGNNQTFHQWNHPDDELAWRNIPVINTNQVRFNDVDLLNANDGWAVAHKLGNFFIINRFENGQMTSIRLRPPTGSNPENLHGVSAVSNQEAWAVGIRDGREFTISRWQGGAITNWCKVLTTSSCGGIAINSSAANNRKDLYAVKVLDINNNGFGQFGFAVGGRGGQRASSTDNRGTILIYDGTTWSDSPLVANQSIGQLYGVSIIPNGSTTPIEAFAVGRSSTSNREGKILRWNGVEWQLTGPGTTTRRMRAISMIDTNGDGLADYGWAVGDNGLAYEFDGGWQAAITIDNRNIYAIKTISKNNVWAVGDRGNHYHWDGNSWSTVNAGVTTNRPLRGIAYAGPNNNPKAGWTQRFN